MNRVRERPAFASQITFGELAEDIFTGEGERTNSNTDDTDRPGKLAVVDDSPLALNMKDLDMHESILVPIDGSQAADAGLAFALDLATALKSRLVLLHVVDVEPLFLQSAGDFKEHRDTLREYGNELLAKAAVTAQDRGLAVSYALHETIESNAASIIVAEAISRECCLIVLGTHGRHPLSELLLGRDAELVLRDSAVPVLFVRATRASDAAPGLHGSSSRPMRDAHA